MMSQKECLQKAWAALLRGDLAERDRYCDLATNLHKARERQETGKPIIEGQFIEVPLVIALPDRSGERLQ